MGEEGEEGDTKDNVGIEGDLPLPARSGSLYISLYFTVVIQQTVLTSAGFRPGQRWILFPLAAPASPASGQRELALQATSWKEQEGAGRSWKEQEGAGRSLFLRH